MKIFENMRNDNALSIQRQKRLKVSACFVLMPSGTCAGGRAIPVSLCGTRHEPIAAAEKVLPRNLRC